MKSLKKQLPGRGNLTATCPSGLPKFPLVKQRSHFVEMKSPFPKTIRLNSSF